MRAPDAVPNPNAAGQAQSRGRYAVYGEIGSGGMATIEYGRLRGPRGFSRPVAIKRLHPHFAKDPEVALMFLDEAHMSARLHHANLMPTIDVIEEPDALALVMEYVHGESLAQLLDIAAARGELVPMPIAVTLACGVLHGLHAAHEARDERGEPLQIVHRDISPENVLVGADGVPRVLDFGVAKAVGRLRTTSGGEIKGKLMYMPPEQVSGQVLDRRADVYAASVVLWEALAGRQLFDGPNESALIYAALNQVVDAPSAHNAAVPAALDHIVLRGLSRDVAERFGSAREMALALENEVGVVTQSQVADWVQLIAGERLAARARKLQSMQERAETAARSQLLIAADAVGDTTGTTRRPRRALGWIAGVTTVLLLVLWGLLRGAEPRARVAIAREPAPRVQPVQTVQPVRAVQSVQAVQAAPAEPAPAPAPKPAAHHESKSARTAAARQPEPTAPAPAAIEGPKVERRKAGCVPPYVIDSMGIRHPKPECL